MKTSKPYCISKYEKSDDGKTGHVICEEYRDGAAVRSITGQERMEKAECKKCPMLSAAIDLMIEHRMQKGAA
jgi:hypothetical protein